jgi:uncharacterized protein (DUF362 family)
MINYEKSDVTITYNKDESKALIEGLDLIKVKELFSKEDIIVVTPNWVNANKPNPKDAVVVGNKTLHTLIKYLKEINPKRLIIATASAGNDTMEVMKKVGYDKIIEEEQVEFIDFNRGPYVTLTINSTVIKDLKVNEILTQNIKLVSFTQLKQHEEATMSAAIKNIAMGIPTCEEHGSPKKDKGIHDDLHDFIACMAKSIKIDLSIISCNPVMVGTGPNNGKAVHTNLVIVGNNPLSSDVIGGRLLGFKPQAITYLYKLEQSHMKETDINKINFLGLSLKEAQAKFSKAVYKEELFVAD